MIELKGAVFNTNAIVCYFLLSVSLTVAESPRMKGQAKREGFPIPTLRKKPTLPEKVRKCSLEQYEQEDISNREVMTEGMMYFQKENKRRVLYDFTKYFRPN